MASARVTDGRRSAPMSGGCSTRRQRRYGHEPVPRCRKEPWDEADLGRVRRRRPARRALDTAIDLAKRFEASITVVSVVPMHPGRMPMDPWDDREVHARELREARQLLAQQGITAELLEPVALQRDHRADRRGRRLRHGRDRFARPRCGLAFHAGQRPGAWQRMPMPRSWSSGSGLVDPVLTVGESPRHLVRQP